MNNYIILSKTFAFGVMIMMRLFNALKIPLILLFFLTLFSSVCAALDEEFQVNDYTNTDQENPLIGIQSDDDLIICWASETQDGSNYGVYCKRYDSSGTELSTTDPGTGQGNEFQVNTFTSLHQNYPAMAVASDDNFVVVWRSQGQDVDVEASNYGIFGMLYNPNGEQLAIEDWNNQGSGNEFQVNTYINNHQNYPNIDFFSDGNFVVVWDGYGAEDTAGVYAQIFDKNGERNSAQFIVNNYTSATQGKPQVKVLPNDKFVVVYESSGQDGSFYGAYGRIYNSDGTAIENEEFLINQTTNGNQQHVRVDAFTNNNFVVTWDRNGLVDGVEDNWGVYYRIFDDTNAPVTTELRANTTLTERQWYPDVAVAPDGNFLIAWASRAQDEPSQATDYGIYAQRFKSDGSKLGPEFLVNTHTSDSQGGTLARRHDIAFFSDGNFVVVWASENQDGSNYGVYAEILTDPDDDFLFGHGDTLKGDERHISSTNFTALDLLVGNVSDVNNFYTDFNTLEIRDGAKTYLELDHNFSASVIDLMNLSLAKNEATGLYGYTVVSNLSLPSDENKAIYIDALRSEHRICVKDAAVGSVTEFSSTCTGANETLFTDCDATGQIIGDLNCIYLPASSQYKVSGLSFSAVKEYIEPEFVRPCADQGGVVCELEEECSIGEFSPASDTERCCLGECLAPRPDLIISQLIPEATTLKKGRLINVAVSVENASDIDVNDSFNVSFYLDELAYRLLEEQSVERLSARATETLNFTFDSRLSDGLTTLHAMADSTQLIDESDENNNVNSVDVFVEVAREICDNGIDDDGDGLIDLADPDCVEICGDGIDNDQDGLVDEDCFPDLIIEDITLSAERVMIGETVEVRVKVNNIGRVDADFSVLSLYLDSVYNPPVGVVEIDFVGLFDPEEFLFFIDTTDWTARTYDVLAFIDSEREVIELNENNNVKSKSLIVEGEPLVVDFTQFVLVGEQQQFLVRDENGKALEGAEIKIYFPKEIETASVFTDSEGKASYRVQAEGTHDFSVSLKGFNDFFSAFEGVTASVDLAEELETGETQVLRVLMHRTLKPLPDLKVIILSPVGEEFDLTTDAEGKAFFRVAEVGKHTVRVLKDGFVLGEASFSAKPASLYNVLFGAQGVMASALNVLELLGPGLLLILVLLALVNAVEVFRHARILFKEEAVGTRAEQRRLLLRVVLALIAFAVPVAAAFLSRSSIGVTVGLIELFLIYVLFFALKRYRKAKAVAAIKVE